MQADVMITAATVAAIAAGLAVHRSRGSTAVPAAWWAVAACVALAVDGWVQRSAVASAPAAACIRLVVAALAVCPAMSLLGAKRPQHGVWQLIVASLAAVVALPAASAWLVRPGSFPDVHPLGRVFLLALTVVGWLNFVATNRGVAATAIAGGQLAILRPLLPGVATDGALPQPAIDAVGAVLVAVGAVAALRPWAAALRSLRAGKGPIPPRTSPVAARIDPAFCSLRDALGAAWALRIAERFNVVATERGWPCRLHFAGLDVGGDPTDTAWHRDALRAFRALMRRFVDEPWLERHGWTDAGA